MKSCEQTWRRPGARPWRRSTVLNHACKRCGRSTTESSRKGNGFALHDDRGYARTRQASVPARRPGHVGREIAVLSVVCINQPVTIVRPSLIQLRTERIPTVPLALEREDDVNTTCGLVAEER